MTDLIPRDAAIAVLAHDRIRMNVSGTEFRVISTQDHIDAIRAIPTIDPAALEPQPDPRDEVIKGLVEAATDAAEAIDMAYGSDDDESPHRHSAKLRAALAAAKAVQHN